jgi:hypothetical protein
MKRTVHRRRVVQQLESRPIADGVIALAQAKGYGMHVSFDRVYRDFSRRPGEQAFVRGLRLMLRAFGLTSRASIATVVRTTRAVTDRMGRDKSFLNVYKAYFEAFDRAPFSGGHWADESFTLTRDVSQILMAQLKTETEVAVQVLNRISTFRAER